MIRIVLVEDEPSAMRHLRSIVELRCPGFEVVETAENGLEGFEKIKRLKPDVVITDIKMPIMDGIKLVSNIKNELPFVYSIIVSGYQDFEYAKGAIQSGVVDYLLKPVNPGQLKELLDSIRQRVEAEYYEKGIELLRKILVKSKVEQWQLERYLPYKDYSGAIIRMNGLPSRFVSGQAAEMNGSVLEAAACSIKEKSSIWVLPGRDEQEQLFVYSPEVINKNEFEALLAEVTEKLTAGYSTLVFASAQYGLQDYRKMVSLLYRTLDNKTVIGLSQKTYAFSEHKDTAGNRAVMDSALSSKLSYLIANAMYKELKQELEKLFKGWEKEQHTLLWVESYLRQLLNVVEKNSPSQKDLQNYDIEFLLGEALSNSAGYGELMTNVWELIEKISRGIELKNHKVDTPGFFSGIERYVEQNISRPLSLQSVCVVFGISQTYLSRLFRKYKDASFNAYLTKTRVEKAKQIIGEHPNIPLKDVAAIVGYNDQFYFSKVFRSVTGVPPSEYSLKK